MKNALSKVFAVLVIVSLLLSACSSGGEQLTSNEEEESYDVPQQVTESEEDSEEAVLSGGLAAIQEVLSRFPNEVVNTEPSIEGGILRQAVVADSGFRGLFDMMFYEDALDSAVLDFMIQSILSTDENLMYSQEGLATYTYDIEEKTITITQVNEATWHDGHPVTLDDLVFAYEVICHNDYDGLRYGDNFINIVGVEEYKDGEADTISGLVLSEDKMTLTIHFKEFFPSILIGGIWTYPAPRHHFEGVAVADMSSSPQVRVNPINFGPFKVKNIIPGEAVELERFDDFWLGAPKLDGVILEIISSSLIPVAMEEGRYDVAAFSIQQYPDYMDPTNYVYLSEISRGYTYTGFRLGTFDWENGQSVTDENSKMWNTNLRKAIGYAVDHEALSRDFFNGLRFPATSIINPFHPGYIDYSVPGYLYDPERAKALLDEAGYIDIDGDGFREDPNGEQLTIVWAVMEGENMDTYAQYKIQSWEDVGLRVELYNGRLTEFNAFYELIQNDTDDGVIDMYDAAWNVAFDPNPARIWGPNTVSNFTRYTSDTFNEILDDIASDNAWDNEWLLERYSAWQHAFYDEIPAIPTLWRIELNAVNNRVKNYSMVRKNGIRDVSLGAYHLWELTADEPYVNN